ncbi:signal transduction histidine kinase [Pelomonas aquatica]|uniref:histidine kinase n=1 Tax=Pelomonas aquatica TaxID=431058 RepID=A0ABU1ZEL6_9BURK|nr:ATP-binding protein [Pelomonas aquatica]MDR7298410.1 signal transduction histidine kinase [Pelomonas aquatica]
MFGRRLTWALVALAAAAVAECALALWSLRVAERQVLRGRVAADIQLGFAQLAADKQRLRLWAAQRQFDAGAEPRELLALAGSMRGTLDRLDALAAQAVAVDDRPPARARQLQRRDALAVLRSSVDTLVPQLGGMPAAPGAANPAAAWAAASERFAVAHGRDLRQLLAESIAREDEAVREKRVDTDRAMARMRTLWLAGAATLGALALALALYFARALRRPLASLGEAAVALQRGELGHRIQLQGSDEFALLAGSVNAMAEELSRHRERDAQRRHVLEQQVAERTRELSQALQASQAAEERRRRLFADISHELRTPTTVIRGEAEVTLRGRDKPVDEYQGTLRRIADTAGQLGKVIDDLLTVARHDIDAMDIRRVPLDLAQPLAQAVEQAQALAAAHGVRLAPAELPPRALPLQGDAQRLRQLLVVLLDNAVRYSHPGGTVRVAVEVPGGAPARAEVRIEDEGIGLAPDDLAHAFEQRWRSERARRHRPDGSGLGLAIALALARGHDGDIRLAPRDGGGTVATVVLPLTQESS